MFGIGIQELLVLLFILGLLTLPVVVLVVVVLSVQRSQSSRVANNPNLLRCPDCGGMVSRQAPACPHCGRPMSPAGDDLS